MQPESWRCLWSVRLDRHGTVELPQATDPRLPPQAQQRPRFCVQSKGTDYRSYGRTREVRSRRRIRKRLRRRNRRELRHCMKGTARWSLHRTGSRTLPATLGSDLRMSLRRAHSGRPVRLDTCPLHSLRYGIGGSGEIRTHGGVTPSAVFKTAALNHSATLPYFLQSHDLPHHASNSLFLHNQIQHQNKRTANFKTAALNHSAISP